MEPTPVLTKGKILLVEDDLLMVRMYQRKLSKEGYDVKIALDGMEGLDILKTGYRPDIVLLDIMMPRMNGFQFLENFKKEAVNKSVPVVMLTNLIDTNESKKRSFDLGATDYVVKSEVSMEDVVNKVQEILSKTKK